ncbi:MAG: 37S ribosomal protein, mitochondrial [Cirrosporium novae-zelandiae]|nr:MAG: 37S ribosomal protein, mitochondrial [Cirrosporium novae-zelandiae]
MIIRYSLVRQGQRLLGAPQNLRSWSRSITTTLQDVETLFQNSIRDTAAIESSLQDSIASNATKSSISAVDIPAEYREFKRQQSITNQIGPRSLPHYHPHDLVAHSPSPEDITLPLLLASQTHLGHATSLWNPANSPYIFGIRNGIHIISLEVTAAYLRRACKVVSGIMERGGLVLFVGTRKGQKSAVTQAALRSGGCHLFDRWIPGSITNAEQLLSHCAKKVLNEFDKPVHGFSQQLEETAVLKPDLVVVLNPLENTTLLRECGQANIPTIGIIDTDANPAWVTYPIPANDDSLRSVEMIAGVLGKAGRQGKETRLQSAKNGKITYTPVNLEKLGQGGEDNKSNKGAVDMRRENAL